MATWIWIVIAAAAVIVIGLAVLGGMQRRQKALNERRDQARQLRQEADSREALAREHEEHAMEARRAAAQVGSRADELDPDREASRSE